MAEFEVTIETLSPTHLGSGEANVNVDSDIIHDELGFPYFPAKRFKGLLYESALEVQEMMELSGLKFNTSLLEEIFHHNSSAKGEVSNVQLIVPNFYLQPIKDYKKFCEEWQYLQKDYAQLFRPSDVLEAYTSLRYQTKLTNGIAEDGSLHNMRVLNKGLIFYGTLELVNGSNEHLNFIALAIRNLTSAGLKRNRGFGRIKCSMRSKDGLTEKNFIERAFSVGGI